MTHAGRVKCIYIDPPYNTGNRDFIYNDRFINKEDGWRHSKWIEFMHRRLILAKDLLREDGVIFVSIDDNELFHLGMLMNEVFGEGNWISTMIWKKSYGGGAKAKHIVGLHEYVLCYACNKGAIETIDLPPSDEVRRYYKFTDEKFAERGPYRLQPLATTSMDARPNLRYSVPFEGEEIWPEKQWQWAKERALTALANNELSINKTKKGWSVNYKQYLFGSDGEERAAKMYSVLDGPYTQAGTGEVKDLLGDGKAFSFPKPSNMVLALLRHLHQDKNAVVVDFFAGSGTTGHAVLKLNAEDGGSRQFILVSSTEATDEEPDKNLCRDVCAKRLKRVCEGYGGVGGLEGGFAYLRIEKMEPGRLLRRLQHEQVWITLQMLHLDALTPEAPGGIVWAAGEGRRRLIYLTQTNEKTWGPLERALEENRRATIYTWQPELVKHHAPKATVRPIPKFLMERLGIHS